MSVHQDPTEPWSPGGELQTGVHPLTLLRRWNCGVRLSQQVASLFNNLYLIYFLFRFVLSRCAESKSPCSAFLHHLLDKSPVSAPVVSLFMDWERGRSDGHQVIMQEN